MQELKKDTHEDLPQQLWVSFRLYSSHAWKGRSAKLSFRPRFCLSSVISSCSCKVMSFPTAVELYGFLTQSRQSVESEGKYNDNFCSRICRLFTYCLTQCKTVDILPFLGVWEHVKVGTFHMLFPELHLWTKSLHCICTCEQVLISALHSCVQVIQMLKYICQIYQCGTPLVNWEQLSAIILLIVKNTLSSHIHTG